MAELLVARTAAARARTHPVGMSVAHPITAGSASEGADGLRPQDLRNVYFPGEAPDAPEFEPQTIALVDAYNDPDAEADLKVYDEEFSLPECTANNGCFKQVNQNGETGNPPFPATVSAKQEEEALCESATAEPKAKAAACKEVEEADGWASETAIDIEMAHAACQNCHILLVEASESEESNLEAAEDTAVRLGANEVSNSWGGNEPLTDSEAFNHPGVVIAFAGGDHGYLDWERGKEEEELYGRDAGVNYPASSPHVVAVGGTSLKLNGTAGTWSEETAWRGGGSGCSLNFNAQPWQSEVSDWSSVGCEGRRAVADVAADANPYTGVAIYDSVPYIPLGGGLKSATVLGWWPWGGTSVATPIIAAMFALAGGSHGVKYPAQTLYSHLGSAALHDITEGANGKCEGDYSSGCSGSMNPLSETDCGQGVLICNAGPGYDGPTGVGTPNGIAAFRPAHQYTGGGPEAPLTEECGGPISAGTGKVCGTLNPHSSAKVGYYFAYNKGTQCTGGKETALQPEVQGQTIGVSGELFGLEPHTEYTFCLLATDPAGETLGAPVTFVTDATAPEKPQTLAASDVTADSATLNGRLGPQLIKMYWYFRYAPQFACTWGQASTTLETEDTMLGEPGEEVSAAVTSLQPGTEYHVCLVAKNTIGSTIGSELRFVTKEIPPTVDSVSVQSTSTEATIEAITSPDAQTATCEVQYGTSEAYGSTVPCKEALGNNGERVLASAHLTGLKAGTTYYFRVVVENLIGKSSPGEGKGTVTTPPTKPGVTSEYGSGMSATTAQVAGAIKPEGATAQYYVEYGETEAYGQKTTGGEVSASSGEVQVGPETIAGLKPNTTYDYRLRVVSVAGEAVGRAEMFTTLTSSPIVGIVTPILIPPITTTTSACSAALASTGIVMMKGASEVPIKLTGTGTGTCRGGLTLTVKTRSKGKRKTTTIGTVTFSILAGKTATVELKLNADGRALLSADHGRLSASLTVLKFTPAPTQTLTDRVQLLWQKARGKTKR